MSVVPRNDLVYCEDGEDDDIATVISVRSLICMDKRIDSNRPPVQEVLSSTDTRILLLRVHFLNEERTHYDSVCFSPTDNYQVLAEFGFRGSRYNLTEQHVKTLMEHLPALCEAMQRSELYTCKDVPFRLRSSKTHNKARIYRDRKCVSFTL